MKIPPRLVRRQSRGPLPRFVLWLFVLLSVDLLFPLLLPSASAGQEPEKKPATLEVQGQEPQTTLQQKPGPQVHLQPPTFKPKDLTLKDPPELLLWKELAWTEEDGKPVRISKIRYRCAEDRIELEAFLHRRPDSAPYGMKDSSLVLWAVLPDGTVLMDKTAPLRITIGSRIYTDSMPFQEGRISMVWEHPPLLGYLDHLVAYVGDRLTVMTQRPAFEDPEAPDSVPRILPLTPTFEWPPRPQIDSVQPTALKEGGLLTVRGRALPAAFWQETPGIETPDGAWLAWASLQVTYPSSPDDWRDAKILSFSDTELTARIPEHAETGPVRLKFWSTSWNDLPEFEAPVMAELVVRKPPEIENVVPASAPRGEVIEVFGRNFWGFDGSAAWQTKATVGNQDAIISGRGDLARIRLPRLPPGTYPLTIRNKDGLARTSVEVVVAPPEIRSIYPTSAAPGAEVTLYGRNFDHWQGSNRVFVNGLAAEITACLEEPMERLRFTVPPGASSGPVLVRTAWGEQHSLDAENPFVLNVGE
ncbi:MAG: IPT/TIG domain-containing protein [Acidobacteria bacterium]|nr:IPT/TIG domain-containing protein [Acidobacteriota bacterium]